MNKRLIEVDFPLKKISEESTHERNIHYKHISALHLWWARRPSTSSRATTFAALVPSPENDDDLREKLDFTVRISSWKSSFDQRLIEEARKAIRVSFGGRKPKVLDCFAGSGVIPLEALRIGCETYALELNPVAVLILKAVLEYPQKLGNGKPRSGKGLHPTNIPFLEDLENWGDWVFEEARKEIGGFYPFGPSGNIPVGYIWARTIKCQNPSCHAEIPLMRQLWLAKKKNKRIALKIVVNKDDKKTEFKIVEGNKIDFDPSQGTCRRATALCPICAAGIDAKSVRRDAKRGLMGQRLIAVVSKNPKKAGKKYRVATENDLKTFKEAETYLEVKIRNWRWDFDPIPNEPTPSGEGPGAERAFSVRKYGLNTWGDLFNSRQKLSLITFIEKVRLAYERMLKEGYEPTKVKAIVTYLAFTISKLCNFNSSLARWANHLEKSAATFARHALSMLWDYCEINPFSESTGCWKILAKWSRNSIWSCFGIPDNGFVTQGTATRLPFSNDFFDAVITDPPYYDNIPYSDLSDFFYVWLKRAIGDLYPQLFATPLTPKSQEIVMNTLRHGNSVKNAKKFFEDMITQSFGEIHRVLKLDGIAVIVFAYKSTDAWETIINSLLRSGLVLTASWPIHTEMKARLRAKESAALASSVYMVCRKRSEKKIAYFNEIKEEIESKIKEKLTQFWEQGISGADFFVSAIGPAVEVFGKYSKVEKLSGKEVSVQDLLEYVRKIVSEFALEQVLKGADLGGVDAETRFYLLWRWTFGNARVLFDDAIKLSRPMGVELTDMWDRGGFVKKEKEYVRVLGPKARAEDASSSRKTKFTSMIDVLHHIVILWERGNKEHIKEVLEETGYGGNEIFWQTAQAISEVLPKGDKEKQLLQGFLYGKEVYVKEARGKKTLLDFAED